MHKHIVDNMTYHKSTHVRKLVDLFADSKKHPTNSIARNVIATGRFLRSERGSTGTNLVSTVKYGPQEWFIFFKVVQVLPVSMRGAYRGMGDNK